MTLEETMHRDVPVYEYHGGAVSIGPTINGVGNSPFPRKLKPISRVPKDVNGHDADQCASYLPPVGVEMAVSKASDLCKGSENVFEDNEEHCSLLAPARRLKARCSLPSKKVIMNGQRSRLMLSSIIRATSKNDRALSRLTEAACIY
jgi:hypothetical protein